MGVVETIDFDSFPKQGDMLGLKTKVVFNYDTSRHLIGTIVRDDREHPFRTLIQLDDGRILDAVECQHAPQFLKETQSILSKDDDE